MAQKKGKSGAERRDVITQGIIYFSNESCHWLFFLFSTFMGINSHCGRLVFGFDGRGELFFSSSDIALTCRERLDWRRWSHWRRFVCQKGFATRLVDVTSSRLFFSSLPLDLLIRRYYICGLATCGCHTSDFDECAAGAALIGGGDWVDGCAFFRYNECSGSSYSLLLLQSRWQEGNEINT